MKGLATQQKLLGLLDLLSGLSIPWAKVWDFQEPAAQGGSCVNGTLAWSCLNY